MGSGLQKALQQNESIDNREPVEKSQVTLHNNNIPQDIFEDILNRLPLKSLLQLRFVSKHWHSTISNLSFHRRGSATSVFAYTHAKSSGNTFRHSYCSINENGSIDEFRVQPWCQLEDTSSVPIISNSCDGMLLLCHGRCIFLLNPTTHYIDKVLILDEWNRTPTQRIQMGFCYDESIGDYKAIIFVTDITINTFLKVASLKEKKWIEFRFYTSFHNMSFGPYVNDRLHSTADDTIYYFNPIKNVFEEVACPQMWYEDKIVGLGVLDDCLCMARRMAEHRSDVEVLKMKEYGVAESWTSLFVIKDLEVIRRHGRISPLLRTEDGDILLIDNRGKMYRYNLAEKLYTEFIILKDDFIRRSAVTYVESLCSPNRPPPGRRGVRESYWRKVRKQWFLK